MAQAQVDAFRRNARSSVTSEEPDPAIFEEDFIDYVENHNIFPVRGEELHSPFSWPPSIHPDKWAVTHLDVDVLWMSLHASLYRFWLTTIEQDIATGEQNVRKMASILKFLRLNLDYAIQRMKDGGKDRDDHLFQNTLQTYGRKRRNAISDHENSPQIKFSRILSDDESFE